MIEDVVSSGEDTSQRKPKQVTKLVSERGKKIVKLDEGEEKKKVIGGGMK